MNVNSKASVSGVGKLSETGKNWCQHNAPLRTRVSTDRGLTDTLIASLVVSLSVSLIASLTVATPVAAQSDDLCSGDAATTPAECEQELPPPLLKVSQAFGAVVVIWTDYARNDYGYELYRDGLPYHSAAAGETSFVDRLAIDGQSYSYAVRPMVVEPELAGRATVAETVYVQNSAWSTLDPGDAVRTANAQTIVEQLQGVDPAHRDTFVKAITGDSEFTVGASTQAEAADDVEGSSDDDTASAARQTRPDAVATFSLVESVLEAETNEQRHSATELINDFLAQQGSNRRLYSVFGLNEYNPDANQQHRLITEAFNDIRLSLLDLDFSQLDSSLVDSSITDTIVGLLDNARDQGLRLTQTRGEPTSAQENAPASETAGASPDSATGVSLQPTLPAGVSETYQTDAQAQSGEQGERVRRQSAVSGNGPAPTDTTDSATTPDQPMLQPVLADQRQQTGQNLTNVQATTDTAEQSTAAAVTTLELDQGVPQQQLSSESGEITILDLKVEPGQGFETLSLDQPIPSGEGDRLDLNPSTNAVKLETLPVQ